MKNCVFGPGTLPQAPFFLLKIVFLSWNVAAGAFFNEKLRFWSRNVAAGAFVVKNEAKCEPPPKNDFLIVSHRNLFSIVFKH